MKVEKHRLVALLQSMGVEAANEWAKSGKLAAKINQGDGGITRYMENPDDKPADPELRHLYEWIVDAQKGGELIEPVDSIDEPDQPSEFEITYSPMRSEIPAAEPESESEGTLLVDVLDGELDGVEVPEFARETEEVGYTEPSGAVAVAVKKKRGRPPKIKVEQTSVPVVPSAPKRRGRPPKVKAEQSVTTDPPKRRGRPPKVKAEEPTPTPVSNLPKRRGRPPKVQPSESARNLAKKVSAARKKATATPRNRRFETFGDEIAFYKKNPPIPPGPETMLGTMIAELQRAGRTKLPKPITKYDLLNYLAQKFKIKDDRKLDKVAQSIDNTIPGRLRWMYGIYVWKLKPKGGITGYWIQGDGKTPQPGSKYDKARR